MNYDYLKSYCNDLIKSATELRSDNEALIKGLNTTFLDIASRNVSYFILLKRLKHYESEIMNIRYTRLLSNNKLNKRALIISDNEHDSEYFNTVFSSFTTISLKTSDKKQIEDCLKYCVKGNILFIYSTIEIEVPNIESEFSIVVSNQKLKFENNPSIEIYNTVPLIESLNAASKLLFITCSSIYKNIFDIAMLKSLTQCDVLINGIYTHDDKICVKF